MLYAPNRPQRPGIDPARLLRLHLGSDCGHQAATATEVEGNLFVWAAVAGFAALTYSVLGPQGRFQRVLTVCAVLGLVALAVGALISSPDEVNGFRETTEPGPLMMLFVTVVAATIAFARARIAARY